MVLCSGGLALIPQSFRGRFKIEAARVILDCFSQSVCSSFPKIKVDMATLIKAAVYVRQMVSVNVNG